MDVSFWIMVYLNFAISASPPSIRRGYLFILRYYYPLTEVKINIFFTGSIMAKVEKRKSFFRFIHPRMISSNTYNHTQKLDIPSCSREKHARYFLNFIILSWLLVIGDLNMTCQSYLVATQHRTLVLRQNDQQQH